MGAAWASPEGSKAVKRMLAWLRVAESLTAALGCGVEGLAGLVWAFATEICYQAAWCIERQGSGED